MKIFTAAQIRACDAYTIHASGIQSLELMERAAEKCVEWIVENFPPDTLFVALCGTGNNGGDGLVITRLLNQRGYGVKAFLLKFSEVLSADCQTNLDKLQAIDADYISIVQTDKYITDIPANIVIIDAILGTGLSRPVSGWIGNFLEHINNLPNRKIAIDIPSGLPADLVPDEDAAILKVQDTLSFQFYKRSFLHAESGRFAGKIHILDIGLDSTFINATHTQYRGFGTANAKKVYKPRDPFGHKGTFGSAMLIGGTYGRMGAITLSGKAALRSGAGLITILAPECGYNILQTSIPEAMCQTSGDKEIENISGWEGMSAIGFGPGIGTSAKTAAAFSALLESCTKPMVVDADGINILAKHPELLPKLPPGSIITPHPKEFERLFGKNTNSMNQLDNARIQAMRYNITIVLKGHHTAVITNEGECWYNMSGNSGMAKGGAGDVLTGIIIGLLAQGYDAAHAASLGVYLHGLAGDQAAQNLSKDALKAGDIVDYLGKAYLIVND